MIVSQLVYSKAGAISSINDISSLCAVLGKNKWSFETYETFICNTSSACLSLGAVQALEPIIIR